MILAFVYDFPHAKSANGLIQLALHGYPVKCLAAPKKILNIKHSKIRITPNIKAFHPRDIAKQFGFEYIQIDHDSAEVLDHMDGAKCGLALGARILKRPVVEKLPIVNMHPGYLPHNRGLDNIKWAVMRDIPQSVTSHVIDEKVDRGWLLERRTIKVLPDDSMLDIFLRLQSEEIDLIPSSIKLVLNGAIGPKLGKGSNPGSMPLDIECWLESKFMDYKKRYDSICENFVT